MTDGQLLQTAQELVIEAGKVSLKYFRSSVNIHTKEDNSLVSKVDGQAERKMRAIINKRFPDHMIYGEEYGGDLDTASPIWILDPIEGTTNYLHGIPVFGSQCAVMIDGQIITAAMYDPVSHLLISAQKNNGAYKNQSKITLSSQQLKDVTLLFDLGRKIEVQKALFTSPDIHQFRSIRRLGSLVTDVTFLTTSKMSCFLGLNAKIYDFAPASLILSESGYRVFDQSCHDWQPTFESSLFACGPQIFPAVKQMVTTSLSFAS